MGRNSGNAGHSNNNNATYDAIEDYVSGNTMYLNQYLRGNSNFELQSDEKRSIALLDSATKGKINECVLYRSVDADAIFGKISLIQYSNLSDHLVYGDNSKIVRENATKIISQSIGKTITERGFMSTSKKESVAQNWGSFTGSEKPIVMRINTNGKGKGFDVSKTKLEVKKDPQKEVILQRGTKYTINRVYSKEGQIYVDVSL